MAASDISTQRPLEPLWVQRERGVVLGSEDAIGEALEQLGRPPRNLKELQDRIVAIRRRQMLESDEASKHSFY